MLRNRNFDYFFRGSHSTDVTSEKECHAADSEIALGRLGIETVKISTTKDLNHRGHRGHRELSSSVFLCGLGFLSTIVRADALSKEYTEGTDNDLTAPCSSVPPVVKLFILNWAGRRSLERGHRE